MRFFGSGRFRRWVLRAVSTPGKTYLWAALAVLLVGVGSAEAAPSPSPSPTPSTADNGPRVTFGIGPTAKGHEDHRPWFSFQMSAGGTYSDLVAVNNYSRMPIDVKVYAVDLLNTADGQISAALEKDQLNDAGGWMKLDLPGGNPLVHVTAATPTAPGTVNIPVKITVPLKASPGDHAGAIMASMLMDGNNAQGESVKVDQRVGSRVYVRVLGALHPSLKVTDMRVKFTPSKNPFGKGIMTITYTITNTGNVKLGGKVTGIVSGLFGTKAKADAPGIALLLPGASARNSVTVSGVVPTLWQRAHLTVHPTETVDDNVEAASLDQTSDIWTVPWFAVVALGLVLLVVVAGWRWRVRTRRGNSTPDGGSGSEDVLAGATR